MSDGIEYVDTRGQARIYPHSFSLDDLEAVRAFVLSAPHSTMLGAFYNPAVTGVRHDVDHSLDYALRFAAWENEHGIISSYYLLPTAHYWRQTGFDDKVRALVDLGHEVGYHHDALTESDGLMEPGLEVFERRLEELRAITPVAGCAAHGSGAGHNNLSIWDYRIPGDFGLRYEAYHLNAHCNYISDNRGKLRSPLEHVEGQPARVLIHPEHWRLPEAT